MPAEALASLPYLEGPQTDRLVLIEGAPPMSRNSGRSRAGLVRYYNLGRVPIIPGQLRWAYVEFEEGGDGKIRPILVEGFPMNGLVAVRSCTSKEREDRYKMKDWRNSGLTKPSFIKRDAIVLPVECIQGFLGNISDRDRHGYEAWMSRYLMHLIHAWSGNNQNFRTQFLVRGQ